MATQLYSACDGYPLIEVESCIEILEDLLDGSVEYRGRDTGISEVIRMFGVNYASARKATTGKTWRHMS